MAELTTGKALHQQIYNAGMGDLSKVSNTCCILLPRAFVAAGYDSNGKLVTAQYADYKKDLPEWNSDFFEHQFISSSLLSDAQKPTCLFVAADKYLLVPGELYKEDEATKWLSKIDFIETTEVISAYYLENDKAYYMYAWPTAIKKIAANYFSQAGILPFAAHLFDNTNELNCCIAGDLFFATLYQNGKLQWHKVSNFNNAEDIAYQIHMLCKEKGIDANTLSIKCAAIHETEQTIAGKLSSYFAGISMATTEQFLQQLYSCAS